MIDFTPENGSTELWLGTHTGSLSGLQVQDGAHGDRASGRIKESLLAERRETRAPSQPDIRKGSIVIRDLRLWHAGMPNLTDEVRVMLALIHFAPWYRNPMRLELSEGLREVVQAEEGLDVPVDWVREEEALGRYLDRGFGNSYDFGQTE
jgi:ectoine hydroxylase-related dioxygenase (phytanoyl-CoA dioxygenase family)